MGMGEIGNVNGENRNEGNGNRNVGNLREEQENVGLCKHGKCEWGMGKDVNGLKGNRGMKK